MLPLLVVAPLLSAPVAAGPEPVAEPPVDPSMARPDAATPAEATEAREPLPTASTRPSARDPLSLARDLIAAHELSAAIFVLDDAIAADPDRAELYRARADARQLRVERRGSLELLGTGAEIDPILAGGLVRAAEDLRRYIERADLEPVERAAIERRIQRLDDTAERVGAGSTRSRTAAELAAIRQRRFRLRTAGAIMAGGGAATAIAGISLAGASARFFPTSPQCLIACAVGGQINHGLLASGGTAAVIGASVTGVGLAMVTRNVRLIREDHPRPRYAWERAVSRTNALRTAGLGFLIGGGALAASGAALAVSAARQYAAASLSLQTTPANIDAITRTANAAASSIAAAPLLAAIGGGLRAATAPPAPAAGSVFMTVSPGPGVAVAGRF